MAAINFTQRLILGLLGVPIVIVVVHYILDLADAVETNPIVAFFEEAAAVLTPEPLTNMFANQQLWQTTAVTLVMYLVIGIIFLVIFSLARWAVRTKERRAQPEWYRRTHY